MPRQRRGPYRQPSDEERRAIIDAHLNGEDCVEVATRLRNKRGTAWSILARYLRTNEVVCRPQGGKPTVSTSTISRALHGECISVKKMIPQPAERNSERIKEERCTFSAWMMTSGLDRHRVYVDESGFNLHLMRTRGRAPVGERAIRTVCGSRGRNVTFITAISDRHEDGIIYHEIVDGGVNKKRFADFLQSLSAIIGEDEEVTVLFDNAPSHQGVENAVALPPSHHIKRLPPYSPFLSPIENVFSVLKAHVKQHMAAQQQSVDDRVSAARAAMSLESWRRCILLDGILMALRSVTGDQVAAQYRHSNTFLPACAAKDDITA